MLKQTKKINEISKFFDPAGDFIVHPPMKMATKYSKIKESSTLFSNQLKYVRVP